MNATGTPTSLTNENLGNTNYKLINLKEGTNLQPQSSQIMCEPFIYNDNTHTAETHIYSHCWFNGVCFFNGNSLKRIQSTVGYVK